MHSHQWIQVAYFPTTLPGSRARPFWDPPEKGKGKGKAAGIQKVQSLGQQDAEIVEAGSSQSPQIDVNTLKAARSSSPQLGGPQAQNLLERRFPEQSKAREVQRKRLSLTKDRYARPATTFALCCLYGFCGASLIFYNKFLNERQNFPHPLHIAWIQTCVVSVLTSLIFVAHPDFFLDRTKDSKDSKPRSIISASLFLTKALPVAFYLAVAMVMSNAALAESSLTFLQMMRQSTIVFSSIFSLALGVDRFHSSSLRWLMVVLFGTALVIQGEKRFSASGELLMAGAIFFEAARSGLQESILGRGGANLPALPCALLVTVACSLLLSIAVFASMLLNLPGVLGGAAPGHYIFWIGHLLGSGLLSFVFLIVHTSLVEHASHMGFVFADLFKDVLVVISGLAALRDWVSRTQGIGFSLQVAGIYAYTLSKAYAESVEDASPKHRDPEQAEMSTNTASMIESTGGHAGYGAAGEMSAVASEYSTSSTKPSSSAVGMRSSHAPGAQWDRSSAASDTGASAVSGDTWEQVHGAAGPSRSEQKPSSSATDSSWTRSTAASVRSAASQGSSRPAGSAWDRSSVASDCSTHSQWPAAPAPSDVAYSDQSAALQHSSSSVPAAAELNDTWQPPATKLSEPIFKGPVVSTVLQSRIPAWGQAPRQDLQHKEAQPDVQRKVQLPKVNSKTAGKRQAKPKAKSKAKTESSSDSESSSDAEGS